jgi:hypothetical protein
MPCRLSHYYQDDEPGQSFTATVQRTEETQENVRPAARALTIVLSDKFFAEKGSGFVLARLTRRSVLGHFGGEAVKDGKAVYCGVHLRWSRRACFSMLFQQYWGTS